MPSYLQTDPSKDRPYWVTDTDIVGNDNADRLAGKWDKSPLDHNRVLKDFRAVKLVKAIQSRLIAIITNLPPGEKSVKVQVPKAPR